MSGLRNNHNAAPDVQAEHDLCGHFTVPRADGFQLRQIEHPVSSFTEQCPCFCLNAVFFMPGKGLGLLMMDDGGESQSG